MKRLIPLLVVLLLAGAAAWHFLPRPAGAPGGQGPGWQGYVEADTIRLAPPLAGRLTGLAVARGDAVAAGAPVFTQDDGDDRAARDQAAATLANLEAPARETEIVQARATLAADQAAQTRADLDLERARRLVVTAATSRQTLDQAQADATSAAAHVALDRAHLAQLAEPTGRAQEIAAQRAALAAAQWRLDQRAIRAPEAGRITETYALPGEVLAAGAPVVELLAPDHVFIRFFVPEPALSRLALGAPVTITSDRGAPIAARVSYIAPDSEYTPPVIFSEETRAKLVWRIEARPSRAVAATLKPGQPVTVHPGTAPPGTAP